MPNSTPDGIIGRGNDHAAYIEAHPKRELTEEEIEASHASEDEELDKELAAEDI